MREINRNKVLKENIVLAYAKREESFYLDIVKELRTLYDDNLRCLTLIIKNNGISQGSHDLEETVIELFNVITSSNNYTSFGRNKALMLIGILENSSEYSLHHNIYLNSNSNYKDYYN